eukprot:1311021-Amphidinium_carterae.1
MPWHADTACVVHLYKDCSYVWLNRAYENTAFTKDYDYECIEKHSIRLLRQYLQTLDYSGTSDWQPLQQKRLVRQVPSSTRLSIPPTHQNNRKPPTPPEGNSNSNNDSTSGPTTTFNKGQQGLGHNLHEFGRPDIAK